MWNKNLLTHNTRLTRQSRCQKLNQTELVFCFFLFAVAVVVAIFQKPKPKRILNVGEVVKNVANANAIEASRPVSGSRAEKHPCPVLHPGERGIEHANLLSAYLAINLNLDSAQIRQIHTYVDRLLGCHKEFAQKKLNTMRNKRKANQMKRNQT